MRGRNDRRAPHCDVVEFRSKEPDLEEIVIKAVDDAG